VTRRSGQVAELVDGEQVDGGGSVGLAIASSRPSGLKSTPLTRLSWPTSVSSSRPVAGSQSFVLASSLVVATWVPSGPTAT
jgi:hypothetical protein